MTVSLEPYPAYKDSGVPSLGQVPAHWEVRRQRAVVDMRVSNVDKHAIEGQSPVRLCNYVDVYKNDRITERLSFMQATASAGEVAQFRARPGDVIITKDSEMWTDIGVPALVEYDAPDLVCGYHLAILRPRPGVMIGDYLFRVTQSQGVAVQYHVSANGVTRYGLSHGAITDVVVPVPPTSEQSAIVKYLDCVDRRIRRYIRAQQRLIQLLEEKKQVAIHRAVTRGLDPGVRLKPSGVEWLGDIPEHWEVQEMARFSRIGNGSTPSRGQSAYWRGGHYPWLNSAHANLDAVCVTDQFVTDVALRECHLPIVRPGSVLVGITGQGKTRGKATVLRIEATINQHLAYITPSAQRVSGDYLRLALTGGYGALRALSDDSGGTKGALTCGALKTFKVALPPRHEQDLIVAAVNRETQICAVAIEHARRQADLANEYRGRLIADVVTGKLDVREAAADQWDEIEEAAAVEEEVLFEEATGLGEDSEFEEGFEEVEG